MGQGRDNGTSETVTRELLETYVNLKFFISTGHLFRYFSWRMALFRSFVWKQHVQVCVNQTSFRVWLSVKYTHGLKHLSISHRLILTGNRVVIFEVF